MNEPTIIYGEDEYKIVCERGKAPLKGLRKALETKKIDPNGYFLTYDDNDPFPMLVATVGFGMQEHTKLLLQYGADVQARFITQNSSSGTVITHNLATHCIASMSDHSSEKKLEMFKIIEKAGLNWVDDQECNLLHTFLLRDEEVYTGGLNNRGLFEYALQHPKIVQLDFNQNNQKYFVEAAIIDGYYRYALEGLKRGLSQENSSEGGLLHHIAVTFGEVNDGIWPLTEYLLRQPGAAKEFIAMSEELAEIGNNLPDHLKDGFDQWKSFALKICMTGCVPVNEEKQASLKQKI